MRCRIPYASPEYQGVPRACPSGVAYPFAPGAAKAGRRRAPAPRPPSRSECFAYHDLLKPKSKVRAGLGGRGRTRYSGGSRLRLEAVERAVGRGTTRIRSPVLLVRRGTRPGGRPDPG